MDGPSRPTGNPFAAQHGRSSSFSKRGKPEDAFVSFLIQQLAMGGACESVVCRECYLALQHKVLFKANVHSNKTSSGGSCAICALLTMDIPEADGVVHVALCLFKTSST